MSTLRAAPLALVLGFVLAIGCDEQPQQPKCAVFLSCYADCRAANPVREEWRPDGPETCSPANYPGDDSEGSLDNDRCFGECGGWDLDVTPDSTRLQLFPLNNTRGDYWEIISECLAGER